MNLKIVNNSQTNSTLNIKDLETELTRRSIEYEEKLVMDKLDEVSALFIEPTLVFAGVVCKREIRSTQVSIGRVSVNWNRPIYTGYQSGKPIRFYPADESVQLPKKTRGSYRILSNCALLSAFLPFDLSRKILNILLGTKLHSSTVKRYTETVGQFASENIEEILKEKASSINLGKDEILIASIDGSSSLINGTRKKSNKRKKKKKIKGKKKVKNFTKDDYLKEAKVYRLSVYNTKTSKIIRTVFVHSIIRQKAAVLTSLKILIQALNIPDSVTVYTLGDGAKWVKDVLDSLHHNSVFLLDFYHAASYAGKVGLLNFFTKQKLGKKKSKKFRKKLKNQGGRTVISDLKKLKITIEDSSLNKRDKVSDLKIIANILGYFEERIEQIDYKSASKEQRPIGSGFIESACKQIVKQRLGISGGRFYLEAAERLMQLRCIIMMDAWDILVDLMYQKQFEVKHCKPSSSYETVISKAA